MNELERTAYRREKIKDEKKIVVGEGVIVFDVDQDAWALPGGFHTDSPEAAFRQAQIIDYLITGKASKPDITKKGFRA